MQSTKRIHKHTDIGLVVCLITIIVVLLLPVPTMLLDLLLSLSISISIVVLISTILIEKPLDLNIFPTILLITTILRLSINVASTRLILSKGYQGTSSAGYVIEAFGNFVMQGNIVIGIIIFSILTIVNFVVITKGASRISEVSARFNLDAMPGKQMSIDAELNSGIINEKTAKEKREILEQETTFYGSMDGANKFVRGDAVAGIIIIFINIIGGIIIAVIQKELTLSLAIKTYTILSIGDGLVSQIPALIISIASGIIVTKNNIKTPIDQALISQIGRNSKTLYLSSITLFSIALLPGLPFLPFIIMSIIFGISAYYIDNQTVKCNKKSITDKDLYNRRLHFDLIKIELGNNLINIVNNSDNNIEQKIKLLRSQLITELGFILPPVRITDNILINENDYLIKIKEIEMGKMTIRPNHKLIINSLNKPINIKGKDTTEPAFNMPAKWVKESEILSIKKENNEYQHLNTTTIIITHLTTIIKNNIRELLSYNETHKLVDQFSATHNKLIKDTIPHIISISLLHKILQNLLSELIPIRDLPTIIEIIAEAKTYTNNTIKITSMVRERLSQQISSLYKDENNAIPIITLSEYWEKLLIKHSNIESHTLSMPYSLINDFINQLKQTIMKLQDYKNIPVIVTKPNIRYQVKSLLMGTQTDLPVLSENEIHYNTKINNLGSI